MRLLRTTAALGLLAVGACNTLDVPNLNNPGIGTLTDNPTRTVISNAATGLTEGYRGGGAGDPGAVGSSNGYVMILGVFGREAYNFDQADPRNITELLLGPLDGGSPAFGANLFAIPYRNIRNANLVLHAVNIIATDPAGAAGMTAEEKEGTTGFAQTIQAIEFLELINTRDANGVPIDVDIDPTGPPAPIATKAEVFTHIVNLLDSAQTHLQAAGSAFMFPLGSGFAGFDKPASFLTFNRAIRARVAVYLNDYAGAITALNASFMDTTRAYTFPTTPDLGVYHSFSNQSGDKQNGLFDPSATKIFANPTLDTAFQLQPGGAPDARFQRKIDSLPAPTVIDNLSSKFVFKIYNSTAAPIPIIRNEELVLIRAEAAIGQNDFATAVAFLDQVRVKSGGLAPYAGALTAQALTDELLYNRRWSLLFEGGHRWIDTRRFGRLLTDLIQDQSDLGPTVRFSKMPFPTNECLARSTLPATGCSPEPGS